jgi:molybdopterin-guanine dinucleotide biosynthesis protein A
MPSAAILAGGRARRFGGLDKSSLRFAGAGGDAERSILERQVAVLRRVADDLLIVGDRPDTAARAAQLPGLRMIGDRIPDQGPLGGLEAALAAARHELVVVVACDMPFVTSALLQHLVAAAGDADAVVPLTERGYHPLCAVYTRACLPIVTRHLQHGRGKMTDLLDAIRVCAVTGAALAALGNPQRLLANVNTRVEYDRALTLPGHTA